MITSVNFPLISQVCEGGSSVTPILLEENPSSCSGFERVLHLEKKSLKSGTYYSENGLIEVVITVNDQYFSWSSCYPIDLVTVKGGPHVHQYQYDPPTYGDNCLSAPLNIRNQSGIPYDLSYIDFCYSNPKINCPSDVTIGCNESTDPVNTGYPATTTTSCGWDIEIDYIDEPHTPGACYFFNRIWTATFPDGSMDQCLQKITVKDELPPIPPTPPADVRIFCTADIPLPVALTATDNCDGLITVSPVDQPSQSGCGITRTWTFKDDCGNTSSISQKITVKDEEVPVINCPDDAIVECVDLTDPVHTGQATGFSNCNDDVTITYSDIVMPETDCPEDKTIERTWRAEDTCGNTEECVQMITVADCCYQLAVELPKNRSEPFQLTPPFQTKKFDFKLSPNPAGQLVTIKVNTPIEEPIFVEVYNFQGQSILQQRIRDEWSTLDLQAIPSGLYLVHLITASGQRITKKLVRAD